MADTKISALSSAGTLTDTDVTALVNGGATTKVTLDTLNTYFEARRAQFKASTAQQTGFAADTYLAGSSLSISRSPDRLQAGTMYRCRFDVTKTAAGVVAPIINLRFGTLGTTADASVASLTWDTQSAATDSGLFEIMANFRSIGGGTSAVVEITGTLQHVNTTTGLNTVALNTMKNNTGAGFNSTTQTIIGLS